MTRKRVGLTGFLLVLFSAIVWWLFSLERRYELGDGWSVSYATAGAGAVQYDGESDVSRFVRGYGPTVLVNQLPVHLDFCNTGIDHNGLIVLFRLWPPTGVPVGNFLSANRLELVDSQGWDHAQWDGAHVTNNFFVYSDRTYSRRDPELTLRWVDPLTKELVFTHTIPNPGHVNTVQEFSPQPLPAAQTVNRVNLRIDGFAIDRDQKKVNLRYDVTSDDPEWSKPWVNVYLSDATGNEGNWLSPHEPAWRVNVVVMRRGDARFPDEEIVRLQGLPIPAPGQVQRVGSKTQVGTSMIEPIVLGGPGQYRVDDDNWILARTTKELVPPPGTFRLESHPETHETPFFAFKTDFDPQRNGVILVQVRDQLGRLIVAQHGLVQTLPMGASRVGSINLQPLPDSQTCDIEIITHRALEFEFFVKPPPPEEMLPPAKAVPR